MIFFVEVRENGSASWRAFLDESTLQFPPLRSSPMPADDRSTKLEQLNRRHDELLSRLDELTQQIEEALAAAGLAVAAADPQGRPRLSLAPLPAANSHAA